LLFIAPNKLDPTDKNLPKVKVANKIVKKVHPFRISLTLIPILVSNEVEIPPSK
jgi:hypothetical protein